MDERAKKAMKNQYKNSKQTGGVYRICCTQTGEVWIRASADLQSAKNRFAFHRSTNLCPEAAMASAWKQYGIDAFIIEILEEIEKKETQTPHEFSEDIATLLELWNEKQNNGGRIVGTK
ncbi:GIY-YIG nuclease family protein [Clostridium minihomine]|uniref:GIY-YIG nuclease family protein n=1 Tax=Clostridium minihomine TaxID=2045012 RepID=UPI000C781027|nr:GIY-YIG nuclease family protein [Clostridium minihomine]